MRDNNPVAAFTRISADTVLSYVKTLSTDQAFD